MAHLKRKTKRLLIRPLESKDFKAWQNAYLKMSFFKNRWDLQPKPKKELSKTHFKKLLSNQHKRRKKDYYYDLAIFDLKGMMVGLVSIMEVARGVSHTAFLGYRIFNSYWELGYGKEAVKAMIDIGFRDIKLHRLEAGIEPGNIRSIKLARRLGMRHEGLKKRAIFLRKQWVDLLMYTLTSEDVGIRFNTSAIKARKA